MLKIAILCIFTILQDPDEAGRTLPFDPVELTGGKEVKGEPGIYTDRGQFRYIFSSAANKNVFDTSPERYEIQWNGSCARMGPMSGVCSMDFFGVYDKKIYLFASAACKKTFLSKPERFVGPDDSVPSATSESIANANRALDKAAEFLGGESLQKSNSLQWGWKRRIEDKSGGYDETNTMIFARPGNYYHKTAWTGYGSFTTVSTPAAGWQGGEKKTSDLSTFQQKMFEREFFSAPHILLLARTRPGVVVTQTGLSKNEAGAEIVHIAIHIDGLTSNLAIQSATGQIDKISSRSRGGSAMIGAVECVFGNYQLIEGVRFPMQWNYLFDGKPEDGRSRTISEIIINPKIEDGLFSRKKIDAAPEAKTEKK
ncbi:MAG: hypothetical protein ACKVS6_03220 [Planctomycetota bacterium]